MSILQTIELYLDFKDYTPVKRVPITEPEKYDGSSHTVEKEKGKVGGFVSFGNREMSTIFHSISVDKTDIPLILPNGKAVFYQTMGFDFLLDVWRRRGYEMDVDFITVIDGLEFNKGSLILEDTDGLTYFKCKITQDDAQLVVERQEETVCNVYGTKDINGNPVTPLTRENILIKALPLKQISSWKYGLTSTKNFFLAESSSFNFSNQTVLSGIESTLSYIQGAGEENDFPYIEAKNELTDITIKLTNIDVGYQPNLDEDHESRGSIRLRIERYVEGVGVSQQIVPQVITAPPGTPFNSSFTVQMPIILRGERLRIYFQVEGDVIYGYFGGMDVEITATATAIDSVVKATRYVGLFEKTLEQITAPSLNAKRFQQGGQFYPLFATNGYGMRYLDDKPFNQTWKDLSEDQRNIFNGGYQVTRNSGVFMGISDDFFANREIGVMVIQGVDESFVYTDNDRMQCNRYESEFSNFFKPNDVDNSLNSIHTRAQFILPIKKRSNAKKIKINAIFDQPQIEHIRKKNFLSFEDKTTEADDKTIVFESWPIAPGTTRTYTFNLQQRVQTDDDTGVVTLEILNRSLAANGDAGILDWTKLGFAVGDFFGITDAPNGGSYIVAAITPTVLTLSGSTPSYSGTGTITVTYPLTNVAYTNRTIEGFDIVEGLEMGGNGFGNLAYSLKRNLLNFYGRDLATNSLYYPNSVIQCRDFANNGNVTTRMIGEANSITENADIVIADLPDPILSPNMVKLKTTDRFVNVNDMLEKLDTVYPDGTIGGFIRCVDLSGRVIRVHPNMLDYEWVSANFRNTGEVRLDSQYLDISTVADGIVTINEAGYDIETVPRGNYRITDGDLVLFDRNQIELNNPYYWNLVRINGVLATSEENLAEMLLAVL